MRDLIGRATRKARRVAGKVGRGGFRGAGKAMRKGKRVGGKIARRLRIPRIGLKRSLDLSELRVLFDEGFYTEQAPMAALYPGGPWAHFVDHGSARGLDPHPLFSVSWYRLTAPSHVNSGMDALTHYWNTGAACDADPHPLFSTRRVRDGLGGSLRLNPLLQYLLLPSTASVSPHPLFDPGYYLRCYPDVGASGVNPFLHYLRYGWREARNPSPYFDSNWYLAAHPDVRRANVNPLIHFVTAGAVERRQSHPLFDWDWYAYGAQDVLKAGRNLFEHFAESGDREGRSPHPLFDPQMYRQNNPDVGNHSSGPFGHFMEVGGMRLANPSPMLDLRHFVLMAGLPLKPTRNPIFDYLDADQNAKRHPHPMFDAEYQRLNIAGTAAHMPDQLLHYVQFRANLNASEVTRHGTFIPTPKRALLPQRSDTKHRGTDNRRPLVSVLVPCYNSDIPLLRQMINSIRTQSYGNWELILVDDGSPKKNVIEEIDDWKLRDERIRGMRLQKNSGISMATNAALKLARGEFAALVDHDDVLTIDALEVMITAILDGDADAAYSDQAYINAWGGFDQPYYKPAWSPTLLAGVMYVGHLLVVRTSLARQVGGFDSNFDRCQDFEFTLRVGEHTDTIVHVPRILYHWRRIPGSVAHDASAKGKLEPVQAKAVNAHLQRIGFNGVAEPIDNLHHRQRLKPKPRSDRPEIAAIVRADGPPAALAAAMDAVSSMKGVNVSLIANGEAKVGSHVIQGKTIAAAAAQALRMSELPYILFLDPAVTLSNDWLDYLLMHAEREGVGLVAPHLSHANGQIVAAGLVVDAAKGLVAAHSGAPRGSDGYAGSLCCDREVSALPPSVALARRAAISNLGGPNPLYGSLLYAIGDLSFRASRGKLRNIAVAAHGLATVGQDFSLFDDRTSIDSIVFCDAHREQLKQGDPYYNLNHVAGGLYASS